MSNFTKICGIDVSKSDLDICLLNNISSKVELERTITNEMSSIYEHFSTSEYDDTLFVLEHTGNYSSKLMYQLSELNRPLSVLNPLQSKYFMSALGQTNKNDKQAAHTLSLAGRSMPLKLYKAPTKEMQERKQILTTLRALEKQKRSISNQIHAIEQLPIIASQGMNALKTVLETIEEQIVPLKERLYDSAKDENFNKKKKFAMSVVGIGAKTAEAILLVTNGLEDFSSASKLAKFIGVTPYSHQSGSSVRQKGRITKFGNSELRSLLYMCTVSAIKHNNVCKELYQRMRTNGKSHKVAAVAVMHKLIKQVFACVKNEIAFDNNYHLKNDKKSN